jgi:hypothetical protein
MLRRVGAVSVLALAIAPMLVAAPAAAELPDILAGPRNPVPECVTPGRLMAYLKLRNPQLDPRYEGIASEYMRHGEQLGVRWDFAFYQMIVETGALSYWRGNRHGDVKPSQNNFAGLGATGRGERGESFPDISTGVRAHLEHLMLYAGRPVDNPVAERTRNVRDWGVLTGWQQTFTRPINFRDMAGKWAPGTKSYPSMLETVAERFHNELCSRPDPRPELAQDVRATMTASLNKRPSNARETEAEPTRPSGVDLAQRAIDQAKAEGNDRRSALGVAQAPAAPPASPPAPYKVLNAPPPEAQAPSTPESPAGVAGQAALHAKAGLVPNAGLVNAILPNTASPSTPPKASTADKASEKTPPARTASAAAAAAKAKGVTESAATPPAANQRCRVWTASYGGQKAVIIRSVVDQVVNFTVLDVNEGSEAREADAFISAYAKNGKVAGEYSTQAQALDKAFELCPEG